jgi:hypothetical protein
MTVTSISVTLHVCKSILEGIKEFSKNLLFSLLSGLNIRALLGIIRLANVINLKLARPVGIHDVESLLADGNSF